MTASIFWFTGLSGVGKTTLSNEYFKNVKKKIIKNLIGYNSKIKSEQSKYPVLKINTDKYTIPISLKKIKNHLNKF